MRASSAAKSFQILIEFLLQVLGCFVFVAIVMVVTQDLQLFPGAVLSLFRGRERKPRSLPQGVESTFITTDDGCRLEVWYLPAEAPSCPLPYVGVIFHGNAGSLENFFLMQLWFQELNIPSYSFDFRGFGHSSGWPSERGLERDSDAVWRYVLEREQIDPSRIIVCGFSVGGAPASRIAALHQPRLLILVSSFTSVLHLLREHPLLKYLARFCWSKLPTVDNIAALKQTSLLLLHGENDTIIPAYHSSALQAAYTGSAKCELILLPNAGHNDVFFVGRKQLAAATLELM